MSTLAQRNAAAFKAMKLTHTVTVGDAQLEIQPPGLIEIIERVEAEVSQDDVKAFEEGQIDVATILREVPALARLPPSGRSAALSAFRIKSKNSSSASILTS